jgi:hypothetical protein
MNTMLKTEVDKVWSLTAKDRCDKCDAQAYIAVKGISGELMFCGHHYNKIMDNAVGYDAMMKFAIQVIDEREKLVENRLQGKSY